MLRFLADENFNNDIVRGLRSHRPDLDVVRVQDVGLAGEDDPTVLAWAASQDRLVLTHDVETLVGDACERVKGGLPMPGVVAMHDKVGIGVAIDDILLPAEGSFEHEWEGQVIHVPLSR
jgi:hypothetical protein